MTARRLEPPATNGAVFRVHVVEQVSEPLASAAPSRYLSPPQPEQQARQLIRMLAGPAALSGPGPWCKPVAGGRRLIRLAPDDGRLDTVVVTAGLLRELLAAGDALLDHDSSQHEQLRASDRWDDVAFALRELLCERLGGA